MLHFLPLLCATLNVVILRAGGKGAKEVGSTEKPKVRPEYLKKFEHGLKILRPDVPKKKSNVTQTTVYVEPEFKRFCNQCEDYWHPNCVHYPHIYDDSKGCVLRTLSPKEVARMNKGTGEETKEESEESEYEEEQGDTEGEGEVEGKAAPEVLMKAEDIEAIRQRLNQMSPGNGSTFNTSYGLRQEEVDEIMRHTVYRAPTQSTTVINAETILFSVEEKKKVTIYKEIYDDANAVLDMTVNNALLSCPREFVIAQSMIPDIQLGVWTKVDLPKGVVMGPFRGKVMLSKHSDEGSEMQGKPEEHILRILHPKTRQIQFMVDGRSNTLGNWCRYINGARHRTEQNIEVFFEFAQPYPYFRTIRPIPRHTELLCDFGHDFRKGKYSNLVNVVYDVALTEPLPKRPFSCSRCGVDQGNPLAVQRHRKLCNATKPKKTPRPKKIKHIIQDEDDEEVSPEPWTPPKHTRPRHNRPKKYPPPRE